MNNTRSLIIGSSFAVFCIALIGLAVYFSVHQATVPRSSPLDASYTKRLDKGAWYSGSQNPKVTIIEYADFQCPGCRAEAPLISQAIAANKDVAQLEFHTYPLVTIHANALQAAKAAEAAGRQGKFCEFHDLLFTNQPDWSTQTSADFSKILDGYASSLKMNLDQFHQDSDDNTIEDPINKDVTAGDAIHIQGTPTLIINGTTLTSLPKSVDDYNTLIKEAAANAH